MDVAQRNADRRAFREFLRQLRYEPQGRFSRAGPLEDQDLDAMLRGKLRYVWRWLWMNVKNAEDMELIERNVRVARLQIESFKAQRDAAKKKREALQSRKQYLLEAMTKAKEREKGLLRTLCTVEREQERMVEGSATAKQRDLLKRAFTAQNDGVVSQLERQVHQLRIQTTSSGEEKSESKALQHRRELNPVQVLVKEYTRMLTTGKTIEQVEFGDNDIAHLRKYNSKTLLSWLSIAMEDIHETSYRDPEEEEYAAHVEEQTQSGHDALVQVQMLLRRNQKEHITRFIATQSTYVKAQQLNAAIDQHCSEAGSGSLGLDEYDDLWGKSPRVQVGQKRPTSDGPGSESNGTDELLTETMELELKQQMQSVALQVASERYNQLTRQMQVAKQQKMTLEHKLELMRTFDQRQQEIIAQISEMHQQCQSLLSTLTLKQMGIRQHIQDNILPSYHQKTKEQVAGWCSLVMEELRIFTSVRLNRIETVRKSVAVATNADFHGDSNQYRRMEIQVPLPELYVNQIQGSDTPQNGFKRIFRAMGVPEYGNWFKLLDSIQSMQEKSAMNLNQEFALLEQAMKDESESHTHAYDVKRVQELLLQLQQTTREMHEACSPPLSDLLSVNRETIAQIVPRLQQCIDNWYEQRAWAVHLDPQELR